MANWDGSGKKIERRRGPRLKPERLLAHYWTGGLSPPCQIREVGMYGAVIAAPDLYYPGTVIRFALEDASATAEPFETIPYAGVWGKVLRNVDGGFCVAFLFESKAERKHFRRFLERIRRSNNDGKGNQTE